MEELNKRKINITWSHSFNNLYDSFESLSEKVDTSSKLIGLSLDEVNQLLLADNKIKLVAKEEEL